MAKEKLDKELPMDEQADWVMSFVDDSREDRDPLEYIWEETELNYLVRPPGETVQGRNTANPLAGLGDCHSHNHRPGFAILKDPETHQEMMTIVSKIVLSLFGEPGFVKAKGVGFEDIHKATVTGKLIEYMHRLPGHYWAFVEWVLATCVFGTGIVEEFWDFIEEPRKLLSVDVDPLTGQEFIDDTIMTVPVYDDPRLQWLDHRDFFPDPSQTMLHQMLGAARRFKVTTRRAEALADLGVYDSGPTKEAIKFKSATDTREQEDHTGDETTGGHEKEPHPDFRQLIGYRYIGQVPWKPSDGYDRREIVVLNGTTVRSRVWPRRLPWFECKLMPRLGSFWGLAPAEVIRHDQDFADVVKMMLADAVVRMVHPSPVVNLNVNPDMERIRKPRPDIPITVEGDPKNAIAWPDFNPPLAPAFNMWTGVKQEMREASGALGAIQGLGLGSKRFSATEAQQTFQQALDRPELFATVLEREFLPQLGQYTLSMYQENLEPGTDDLQKRVGQTNIPVVLADILGEFDIEFVGSRQLNNQQKVAAFREIMAAGANPVLQQIIPWIPLLQKHFREIGADEIAAMVGNEQLVKLHLMLTQMAGPGNPQAGNNNGTVPNQPPLGALPAQLAGETLS